jgi:hypothetical protein
MSDQIMLCPATMCPLIAPEGSPWSGQKNAACPGKAGLEAGCCPWWNMGCAEEGQMQSVIDAEKLGGKVIVVGPVKPKRYDIGPSKQYDCPNAATCRWQEQSPTGLCAPREALKRGLDPKVCLF